MPKNMTYSSAIQDMRASCLNEINTTDILECYETKTSRSSSLWILHDSTVCNFSKTTEVLAEFL